MRPRIFETVATNLAVRSLLGAGPTKFYQFGVAPQNVTYPYAVWQIVGGSPENYLGDRPDIDRCTIQVDVYAVSAESARNVADVLRDSIEPVAHIVRWNGEFTEPETKAHRVSFDVSWWERRL